MYILQCYPLETWKNSPKTNMVEEAAAVTAHRRTHSSFDVKLPFLKRHSEYAQKSDEQQQHEASAGGKRRP